MNISLTSELENFVNAKVAGGFYTSASEVIRESLRLMHTYDDVQKQRIAQLSQAIQVGVEQLHNNQHIDGQVSREKMKRKIDAISKAKQ